MTKYIVVKERKLDGFCFALYEEYIKTWQSIFIPFYKRKMYRMVRIDGFDSISEAKADIVKRQDFDKMCVENTAFNKLGIIVYETGEAND